MDMRIDVRIRPLTRADTPRLMEIAAVSFVRPPTEMGWWAEFENQHAHYYGISNPQSSMVGYMGYWFVADECQINAIAVALEERGRGYGKRLLADVLRRAQEQGAVLATLEVREGNNVAQRLYQSFGFEVVGMRSKFYKDNRENGLIMTLQFQD